MTTSELSTILTNHPEIKSLTLSPDAYDRLLSEFYLMSRWPNGESSKDRNIPQILMCMDTQILREVPYEPSDHFAVLSE